MQDIAQKYSKQTQLLLKIQDRIDKTQEETSKKDQEIHNLNRALMEKHSQLAKARKDNLNESKHRENTLKAGNDNRSKFEQVIDKKNTEIRLLKQKLQSNALMDEAEEKELSYILLKNFETKRLPKKALFDVHN